MALYLTQTSSADFWRLVYNAARTPTAPDRLTPCIDTPCNLKELRTSLPSWADGDFTQMGQGNVHVLVRSEKSRRKPRTVLPHLWQGNLSPGSFYRINDNLFIASPEFTFLHLANTCNLHELIAYGCELCGKYAFDSRSDRGFRTRIVPLTTAGKLRCFLESARGSRGANKASEALDYIMENAESPMETLVAMALFLPFRHGGYGLEKPIANNEIRLTERARVIAKRQNCRLDLSWERSKLVVEFLGKHDHDVADSFDSDRRRTNGLTEMGYEVIELTNEQVRDWTAFELLALRIANRTGKRISKRDRGLTPARRQLRESLYAWNASYGHPGR